MSVGIQFSLNNRFQIRFCTLALRAHNAKCVDLPTKYRKFVKSHKKKPCVIEMGKKLCKLRFARWIFVVGIIYLFIHIIIFLIKKKIVVEVQQACNQMSFIDL
jgi:hypothetical protein